MGRYVACLEYDKDVEAMVYDNLIQNRCSLVKTGGKLRDLYHAREVANRLNRERAKRNLRIK